MKIKQIIIGVIASTLIIGSIGPLDVQAASAGQDDFIMPYYNGYVESGATILSQTTVIDMGAYKVKVFPDNVSDIKEYAKNAQLKLIEEFETDFANIFIFEK